MSGLRSSVCGPRLALLLLGVGCWALGVADAKAQMPDPAVMNGRAIPAAELATGTVTVRATMPNTDELLWPGTLVRVLLTFREEEAVAVPPTAVQVSQTGSFVFVIKDGVARVQPVKVARVQQHETVLESGLDGGETVVTDGHLRLTNGARVAPRNAGS